MNKIFTHIYNPSKLPIGVVFQNFNSLKNNNDSSIQELMVSDMLDFFDYNESDEIMSSLLSKLSDGGTIEIQGSDINQLTISLINHDITVDDMRQILYPNKKSIRTMQEIQELLNRFNITIINKKYINVFEYYILAKK